jgi:hypothetical protein
MTAVRQKHVVRAPGRGESEPPEVTGSVDTLPRIWHSYFTSNFSLGLFGKVRQDNVDVQRDHSVYEWRNSACKHSRAKVSRPAEASEPTKVTAIRYGEAQL